MRKWLALACILLPPAPAMAQDTPVETVTAHGSTLIGLWRVSRPAFVAVHGFFSHVEWGPLNETFCRIAPQKDALAMFCPEAPNVATVTQDNSHVHFAWGTMMARAVIDGELESAERINGHYQLKVSGITFNDPWVSEAVRVTPDAAAPDTAGKSALLRRILSEGLAAVPHDEAAMKKNGPPWSLPALGPVQAVIYLGQQTKWSWLPPPDGKPNPNPDRPDFFSVYLVKFAEGERLCGLRQREDGVLDGFRCV